MTVPMSHLIIGQLQTGTSITIGALASDSASGEDDESEESPIVLPANARLTFDGSDWECEQGYNRSGDGCVTVHSPYNGKRMHPTH